MWFKRNKPEEDVYSSIQEDVFVNTIDHIESEDLSPETVEEILERIEMKIDKLMEKLRDR